MNSDSLDSSQPSGKPFMVRVDDLMRMASRLESLPLTFDVVAVRKQRRELESAIRSAIDAAQTEAYAAGRKDEREAMTAERKALAATLLAAATALLEGLKDPEPQS